MQQKDQKGPNDFSSFSIFLQTDYINQIKVRYIVFIF